MAIPKSWQSEVARRVTAIEASIASIQDATEPLSPDPVEATLDSENMESEEFVSVSSAVPVSVVLEATVDFDGELSFEMLVAGEWRQFPAANAGLVLLGPVRGVLHPYVPKGSALRVVVDNVSEGSLAVLIFQGELLEAEEEEEGEGEGGEP